MQKAESQHSQSNRQPGATQRKGASIESPQSEKIAQLEVMAERSERAGGLAQMAAMADNSPLVAAQRRVAQGIASGTAQRAAPEEKPNNTGLPDNLKSGIESLSGISMGNVKVHYNSSQPAQLNAHAYAQGTDIHVAPGQEQHLPHEAWHVVQQAQGRVRPTLQMKGDVPVNDDAGLEREADVMGSKAVQMQGGGDVALKELPMSSLLQRKILINDEEKNKNQVYSHLTEKGTSLEEGFDTEIGNKPQKIQDLAEENDVKAADFSGEIKSKERIKEWNAEDESYKYSDSSNDAKEISRDTVKYYLYTKFKWLNIGVAAYMTGDVTGLLMATALSDRVSLEVLKGKKVKDEEEQDWAPPENWSHAGADVFKDSTTKIMGVPAKELMAHVSENITKRTDTQTKTPNFYVGGDEPTLPDTFKVPSLSSKVVETDVQSDESLEGTRDAYKKKFDRHSDPKSKPWDQETYKATEIIGEIYGEKKKDIRDMLLPEEGNDDKLTKVEDYRQDKFGSKKVILMWGRLSGLGGGAHTELDSHPITMVQIAKKISESFPSRTIVLIGDKVVSASILSKAGVTNTVIDINAFWNDPYFSDNEVPIRDRRFQHYLIQQMSLKNDAVSIGMRSGSLEATALLGVKTIFIDDKGNNAEKRMEYWAGGAANTRDVSSDEWMSTETEKEGPVSNYKRVATERRTGDKVHSGKMKEVLITLDRMETKFNEKHSDQAKEEAPKTEERIKRFVDKISGYDDLNKLAGDMKVIFDSLVSPVSIKTGRDSWEDVKLDKNDFNARIKEPIEDKLSNMDKMGVGLTSGELEQISGLTLYLIMQTLNELSPEEMHKKWVSMDSVEKGMVRSYVLSHKGTFPNIYHHIFHRQRKGAVGGLGGYVQR